jgi:hypothetical protein
VRLYVESIGSHLKGVDMRVPDFVGILLCALALVGAGCTGRQVLNVNSLVVTSKGAPPTEAEVLDAIVRAGKVTGWRMTPQASGLVFAERKEGSNSASIYVSYSPKHYDIILLDTTMVDRPHSGGFSLGTPGGGAPAAAPRTVHRTYNLWVQELDKAIRGQLLAVGL